MSDFNPWLILLIAAALVYPLFAILRGRSRIDEVGEQREIDARVEDSQQRADRQNGL